MPLVEAAIAAHRFGLGEADLATVGSDARGWLRAQIGPAEPQRGQALPDLGQALAVQQAARGSADEAAKAALRAQVQADMRARLLTAVHSQRPFAERLALFWCNHFTVSLGKGSSMGLVGAFEREAIRPHIAGRFEDLLAAATTHPAMLRYLDNHLSAGPLSPLVQRLQRRSRQQPDAAPPRTTGLNENLARELLELHTLGVADGGGAYGPWGGYGQADVAAVAAVLTGWRGPGAGAAGPGAGAAGPADGRAGPDSAWPAFDARWHQPGDKMVLGRRHAGGPQALRAVLAQLAGHPSTARHIATKLARHFVADAPPPGLVAGLARVFADSGGQLPRLYQALIDAPEAWQPRPAKLKTPEEFVLGSARLLRLGDGLLGPAPGLPSQRPGPRATHHAADGGLAALGQRPQSAPSPAGWPDSAADWLGPEALWQRIEWAGALAERWGGSVDARALATASLGPLLSEATQQQINRAADGPQALALLLLSPDFQHR